MSQVWQAERLVNLKSDKSFLVDPRSKIPGGSSALHHFRSRAD